MYIIRVRFYNDDGNDRSGLLFLYDLFIVTVAVVIRESRPTRIVNVYMCVDARDVTDDGDAKWFRVGE